MAAVLALAVAPDAAAFCGAYVGGADSALTNTASRIAVARQGRATTLTMFNDYAGNADQFGLVIPVPPGFDEDNLRLADQELLDLLDQYTAPRLVRYTCEDFYGGEASQSFSSARDAEGLSGSSSSSTSSGCGGGGGGAWFDDNDADDPVDEDDGWYDTGTDVEVEDRVQLGEYTAYVLSADDGEGLTAWLDARGYSVGEDAAALFDDFIDSGSHFLALEVDLDAVPEGSQWLTPLQLGYYSDVFGLPIRMGTVSSSGVQDLIVFAVTDADGGTVGISNYDEEPRLEDECLLDLDKAGTLTGAYEEAFASRIGLSADPEANGDAAGFSWFTEYSWESGKCDPCPEGDGLDFEDAEDLGMIDAAYGYHVTRLHLRYTPDAVDQDLVLYESGIADQLQYRFVEHAWALESVVPMCGEEQPDPPGACYSAEWWSRWAEDPESEDLAWASQSERSGSCGCSSTSMQFGVLAVPVWLLVRRRRS